MAKDKFVQFFIDVYTPFQYGEGHVCLVQFSSVQFSLVQDGIYAPEKAHMRSTQSLRSSPNVALEKVPMLVWFTMALSRPLKEER